jgi:hypothetical protein
MIESASHARVRRERATPAVRKGCKYRDQSTTFIKIYTYTRQRSSRSPTGIRSKEHLKQALLRLTVFTSSRRFASNLLRFLREVALKVLKAADCATGSSLVVENGIIAR